MGAYWERKRVVNSIVDSQSSVAQNYNINIYSYPYGKKELRSHHLSATLFTIPASSIFHSFPLTRGHGRSTNRPDISHQGEIS
jgi:hypothetical protein